MGFGRSRYTFDGEVDRSTFATVSNRAFRAHDDNLFLNHLATVDTSAGAVTTEIIKFHLVPDMRKRFNKFVKEYGCTATSRKITREEQDKINKTRQSLMQFTSVIVTPAAQKAYLEKNPQKKPTHASGSATPLADSTSSTSKKRNATDAGLEASDTGPSASATLKAKKAKA